jgi:hypothetical protein
MGWSGRRHGEGVSGRSVVHSLDTGSTTSEEFRRCDKQARKSLEDSAEKTEMKKHS